MPQPLATAAWILECLGRASLVLCRCDQRAAARQGGQHDRDEREGGRIEQERDRQPADRDQDAGDRRADEEGEVVERRPDAVGRTEVGLVIDQRRQVGPDGGTEERRDAGGEDGDRDDRQDRRPGQDEDRQHDLEGSP